MADLSDATTPAAVDENAYVLSDKGRFVTDGDAKATTRAQMAQAFAKFRAERAKATADGKTPPALVLFFHGGLVDEAAAFDQADNLYPYYRANGAGYPYFSIWRSGAWETFRDLVRGFFGNDHIASVTKAAHEDSEKADNKAAVAASTAPISARLQTTDGGPDASDPMVQAFAAEYRQRPEVQALQAALDRPSSARRVRARAVGTAMSDDDVAATYHASVARSGGSVQPRFMLPPQAAILIGIAIVRAIARKLHGRDHPGISTISEELMRVFGVASIGQDLWQRMKDDCSDAFAGSDDCVGSAMIDELSSMAATDAPRVLLIGHSAGTIYVKEFLRAADRATIPSTVQFDVIFMAAAIRSDEFANYLAASPNRINHFRSFALTDAVEGSSGLSGKTGIDWFFPASLLYIIAGILEPDEIDMPLAGMQRFIGADSRFANIHGDRQIIDYLAEAPGMAVWCPTSDGAPSGQACRAKAHGGFPEDDDAKATVSILVNKWI